MSRSPGSPSSSGVGDPASFPPDDPAPPPFVPVVSLPTSTDSAPVDSPTFRSDTSGLDDFPIDDVPLMFITLGCVVAEFPVVPDDSAVIVECADGCVDEGADVSLVELSSGKGLV